MPKGEAAAGPKGRVSTPCPAGIPAGRHGRGGIRGAERHRDHGESLGPPDGRGDRRSDGLAGWANHSEGEAVIGRESADEPFLFEFYPRAGGQDHQE